MTRWIAFDAPTASKLSRHRAKIEVVTYPMEDPLRALTAVLAQKASVALLEAGSPREMLVATIRRVEAAPRPLTPHTQPHYVASGFLGLEDEIVLDEEQPRKWWQKLLD